MPGVCITTSTRYRSTFHVLALACSLLGSGAVASSGDRSLDLYNMNTDESLKVTFMRNGRYDPQALEQLNWFLRDWRLDKPARMDPELFVTVWEVYRRSGSRAPIQVHSGYRAKSTNAMLRRRSRAVAEHSQHSLGKALDFHIPDVPTSRLRTIALQMQDGGVGFYPNANFPFVHVDVGSVRHWPRMTRSQLARIFPDGKTLHIPSDGKPFPGYEMAKAEIEADEDEDAVVAEACPNLFQRLFGGPRRQHVPQATVEVASAVPTTRPNLAPGKPKGEGDRALSGLHVTPDGYIVRTAQAEVPEKPARVPSPVTRTVSSPSAVSRDPIPLPPRAPVRGIQDTRLASADRGDKEQVRTSSSVSGGKSMNSLFASINSDDRRIPRDVLGYAALPVLAFMPPPVSVRGAVETARRQAASVGREPSLLSGDIWRSVRVLPSPKADGSLLMSSAGPAQRFASPSSYGVLGPANPSSETPSQGKWSGLERSRPFSLLRWLFGG